MKPDYARRVMKPDSVNNVWRDCNQRDEIFPRVMRVHDDDILELQVKGPPCSVQR